jgi:hypothetical protein
MVVVCRDGSSMSHDGIFLVVCHSEYVVVLPPTVDRSILMCNQCVCMHLCHLYLDCVVSNKNSNVCALTRYKFYVNGKCVPLTQGESPFCSFQSDRIKLSLPRNQKTNILQGKAVVVVFNKTR